MAFTAADVMKRASTILQDTGTVRWTPIELCDWLNEAMRTVVTIKPNALTVSSPIGLDQGTKQTLDANTLLLVKAVRNYSPATGKSRKAIRTLSSREMLDSQIPGWHDQTVLPYTPDVSYVYQDPMAPREFYVIPGNDGTGIIEAIVAVNPQPIPMPASDPLDVNNYTTQIDFDDQYQSILLDFLLARAFSKDGAAPDAAARAQSHLQLATQALGAIATAQNNMGLASASAPTA